MSENEAVAFVFQIFHKMFIVFFGYTEIIYIEYSIAF